MIIFVRGILFFAKLNLLIIMRIIEASVTVLLKWCMALSLGVLSSLTTLPQPGEFHGRARELVDELTTIHAQAGDNLAGTVIKYKRAADKRRRYFRSVTYAIIVC